MTNLINFTRLAQVNFSGPTYITCTSHFHISSWLIVRYLFSYTHVLNVLNGRMIPNIDYNYVQKAQSST